MTKKIYVLRDPRTDQIRYVGQTSDPEARLRTHIQAGQMTPYKKWVIDLVGAGFEPEMEIVATTEDDLKADELEALKIEQLRKDNVGLVNGMHRSTASKWHLVKDLKPNRAYIASEIAGIAGVQQVTALRYLHRLAEMPEWKCIDQEAPHSTVLLPAGWDVELPDNISARNWLNLIKVAGETDTLSTPMLIEELSVSRNTAIKYIEELKKNGWRDYDPELDSELAIRKTGGRPPKTIVKL